MDSGMFQKKQSANRIQRAIDQVRQMGYEFHIPLVTLQVAPPNATTPNSTTSNSHRLNIEVSVENRGVAPFYYAWKTEYALLAPNANKPITTLQGNGLLTGLLPQSPARIWRESFDLNGIPAGNYTLAIRVPNALENGNPVRFANREQDRDAPTWCSLGTITIPDLVPSPEEKP